MNTILIKLKELFKTKARIIKRTGPGPTTSWVIQQPHHLFRWWWCDAWLNSSSGANCTDSFGTLEEAQKNLCYFDGTKCTETIVLQTGK